MLMKKEVIEDNENLKKEIKDLKKQLEEEKNAYINMYNRYVEKDNIINEINNYCFKRMSELNDIQERDEKLQDFCDNKINAFIEVREKIKELKGSDKE